MITVIIHSNADTDPLADTLAMLVSGAVYGLVADVILWSEHDINTLKSIADDTGCKYLPNSCFATALDRAKSQWILFLTPGARLLDQWREIISRYIETQTKPASFKPVMTKNTSWFSTLLRRNFAADAGLLILKEQITAIDKMNNKQQFRFRKLKPVTLPVQIITP